MSSHPIPRFTSQEYLTQERKGQQKNEYFSGEIFAMAGASHRHNLIVTNVVRELSSQLKGRPCQTYANDMRVKVAATGLYTYPDVIAICGNIQFEDNETDTLINPTVIIEVLSRFTEAYDRGEKFAHYRRLDSLCDYVLISQDKLRIECFTLQPNGHWLLSDISALEDQISLASIDCTLIASEIYDKVIFSSE